MRISARHNFRIIGTFYLKKLITYDGYSRHDFIYFILFVLKIFLFLWYIFSIKNARFKMTKIYVNPPPARLFTFNIFRVQINVPLFGENTK